MSSCNFSHYIVPFEMISLNFYNLKNIFFRTRFKLNHFLYHYNFERASFETVVDVSCKPLFSQLMAKKGNSHSLQDRKGR